MAAFRFSALAEPIRRDLSLTAGELLTISVPDLPPGNLTSLTIAASEGDPPLVQADGGSAITADAATLVPLIEGQAYRYELWLTAPEPRRLSYGQLRLLSSIFPSL